MSNNTERIDPTYSDLLKARFCKQYIPRLKEFLSDFDISERIIDNKNNTRDSLGMRFLLKKYDEMKNKKIAKQLKEDCHWQIDNISDKELLLAIEEFFHITTDNYIGNDINSFSEKRNTLLCNLFKLGINVDEQKNIDDTTLFKIANYFGVRKDINELGKLHEPFEGFAYALQNRDSKEIGIYQFRNALRLFSCIRNGVVHPDYKYRGDELNHYHEFIIFTYIGYVLACRRIWEAFNFESIDTRTVSYVKENNETKKIETKTTFEVPRNVEELKKFKIPSEKVEIKILPGKHRLQKVNCNVSPVELISRNHYLIEVCKYEPYKITIEYDNAGRTEVNDELDCYSWFNCYNIVLPEEKTLTSKEYEELSEGTQKLISKVTKSVKNSVGEEVKEAIKHELAALQPLLKLTNDGFENSEELEDSIKDVLVQLANVNESSDHTKKKIEQIHLQIGSLHQRFLGKLDEFSDSLYDLKKKSEILVEKVDRLYEYAKQNRKITKWGLYTLVGLLLFGGVFCLGKVFLLQNPIITTVLVICLVLYVVLFFYFYKRFNPFKCFQGILTAIVGMVASVFIAFSIFQIVIYIRDSYIKTYDFSQNDTERNLEVVKLMEFILETNPKNDEDLRIQLTKYYLDYSGDKEKALLTASPMLGNIEKYKEGVLTIAQVLYSQGKDFWKVRDLLKVYGESAERDSNVINRIQGIMDIWGQGQTSKLSEGFALLKKSAENGDAEAQYYLGYALSHEMTDWEKSKLTGNVESSEFNLIEAVKYLRKSAIYKPKAALELGKLYADLNVKDSAEYYLKKVESNSSGELYKESLYRLGLLYKDTDLGMQYMTNAAFLDYDPAILYKANKENDYKAAIELYSRPGGYQGYRYIFPIVFDYIGLGQKKKALEVLQDGRPYGDFNMNFIMGMDAMIQSQFDAQQARTEKDSILIETWNSKAKSDSIEAMSYMKKSADQGCLYAEMICLFREAENSRTSDNQRFRMSEIGEEIPFAYVLLSYLAHKEERFMTIGLPASDYYAVQAIGKGNQAGRLMLVVPPYYFDFINNTFMYDNTAAYHFNIRQRALRAGKDKRLNILYSYKAETVLDGGRDSLNDFSKCFWYVVSKANNVDLNEVGHKPFILPEISDMELLNEFSDIIIDKQQDNPFIY